MKTYKACFFVSENAEYQVSLNFIKGSGLNIQTKVFTSFSLEKAIMADIIFVDEKTVSHHGASLSNLKIENPYFLPVLLLASGKAIADIDLPACIDDVIFIPFSPTEWKRRIATYLHIRENEIKVLSRGKSEFKTLFTESQHLFETLVNNSPTGVFRTDAKGKTTYVNPRWTEITGVSFERSTRKGWTDILPPNEKEELLERWTNNIASKIFSKEMLRIKRDDGTVRWVLGHAIPEIRNDKFTGYVGTITDVTDLVNAEQALRESENKYRSLAETSSDLILTFDINGKITYLSSVVEKITGYSADEILRKSFWEFIVPEYVESTVGKFKKGIIGEQFPLYEIELQHKNGKRISVEVNSTAIYDTERKIMGGLAAVRDITDRKKVEKALKESEARLKRFSHITTEGIIIHKNGITIDANQAILHMLGYSADDLVGQNIIKKLASPEYYQIINKNIKKEYVKPHDIKVFKKDGTLLPVEVEATNYADLKGESVRAVVFRDITQRREMETALRESENKYRSLAETSSDLIFTFDIHGKLTYLSPVIKKMSGYFADEILHRNFWEFVVPEYVQLTIEKFKSGISGEYIPLYEIELIHKSGKKIPVELNITSLFDAEGNIIGRLAVARDITNRKKAEKALKESEARLKRFSQITKEGIIIHKDGIVVDVNQAILNMLGYSADELIGQNIIKKLAAPKYLQIIKRNTKKEHVKQYDIEVIKKDGTLLPVEIAATNYTNTNGEVLQAVVFRDISRRLEMEKALRESENKYRSLAEVSIDMILTYDLQGKITYVNPVVEKISGYTPEEVIGKAFISYISPEFVDFALVSFHKGKEAETIPIFELELIHKSGRRVPIELNPTSTYDTEGKITGSLTIIRDITVRKRAERKLLLRDKALNVAANAIIITNADGEIEWINKAFTKLSGFSEKEVLGKFTIDLVGSGKQDKAFYEDMHNILKSGQIWTGEFNDRRKNGTLYEVEEVITPVTDKNGKVEHLIGIMNDISERKIAERELLAAKEKAEESSRLKSAFLANMNHEIRTPMNAIMGFSELMLEATSKERTTYAKIVNNSAGQLLHLIDDVIFLSRLQSEKLPVKKIIFSPANLMNEILFMFDLPEVKKGLEFQTRLPENGGNIAMEADVDKIRQVLTNFISNAIKYTEEGYVKLGFEIRNNNILFFEEDSGMGVPKKEQQHIFEAFFRGSKAESSAIRGTGLGLNIAKELVELMGGTIGVSSKPGKGSRFYFILPYKTAKSTFTKAPAHKPKSKKWKELSILIAEDDETNFLYLEVLLKEKVNRVDRACNGKEAVEMVRKISYDLILMDLKMPVMSGSEATVKIKRLYPHIPVIATTAYATAEERERALDAGCDDYLSKPIKKSDLIMHIEKYLSGEY